MRIVLTPPPLPPFLADMFDLRAIEGIPSDEEVKTVHAVMRALNDVVNMPRWYDADLAISLSQHLFDIQMARYRERYPCILFPSNTTYTPPPLPAHIPVTLQPIAGPPSDNEIKSVQSALRLSENMANIPALFDADLTMKLSQHLFDIQFERYVRRIINEDHSASAIEPQAGQPDVSDPDGLNPHGLQENNDEAERNQEQDTRGPPMVEAAARNSTPASIGSSPHLATPSSRTAAQSTIEREERMQSGPDQDYAVRLETRLEDTNKLLAEIGDGIKDVKQVLIGTQHSMARGFNSAYFGQGSPNYTYSFINAKGEDPMHSGLPSQRSMRGIPNWGSASDATLIRCLQFYGIGGEFIQEGDEPAIQEGKRDEAKAQLIAYLNV